jgi:uncharacterized protein (TIGR02145 family)
VRESGEVRVLVKHGGGTRLVEALKSGGIDVTVVDAAHHMLTVEVGESTFGLCNVGKRVAVGQATEPSDTPLTEIGGLKPVRMGKQVWTAADVEVEEYKDGTSIAKIVDLPPDERKENELPTWDVLDKGGTVGGWFRFPAEATDAVTKQYAMGVRGRICPAGWRMPTEADWRQLIEFVRVKVRASGKNGSDSDVWDELRDGEFKAVLGGYVRGDAQHIYPPSEADPTTGYYAAAWMIAGSTGDEPSFFEYYGGQVWQGDLVAPATGFSVKQADGIVAIRMIAE